MTSVLILAILVINRAGLCTQALNWVCYLEDTLSSLSIRPSSKAPQNLSLGQLKARSVAEWSACRNPAIPGSDHYLDLFRGSPEFKSSATLVNSQLVGLLPVGILNNVMFNNLSPQVRLLGMRKKLRSTFFLLWRHDVTKKASPRFRANIFLSPSYLRQAPRTTRKRGYS